MEVKTIDITKWDVSEVDIMNIYADEGTKVVFLGCHGYDHDVPNAIRDGLVVGGIYTIETTDVHSFSTEVYLKEVPGKSFNSVMFTHLEWLLDEKEIENL